MVKLSWSLFQLANFPKTEWLRIPIIWDRLHCARLQHLEESDDGNIWVSERLCESYLKDEICLGVVFLLNFVSMLLGVVSHGIRHVKSLTFSYFFMMLWWYLLYLLFKCLESWTSLIFGSRTRLPLRDIFSPNYFNLKKSFSTSHTRVRRVFWIYLDDIIIKRQDH